MKRTVSRSKSLPAYALDIPNLCLLMDDLFKLAAGEPNLTIEIQRKGEALKFKSVGDLEAYSSNLPARITNMTWRFYDFPDRSCYLKSTFLVGSGVTASAESEAWCAGAIAVVETHARRNKLWYSFIHRWTVWLLPSIILFLPLSLTTFHRPMSYVGLASVIALAVLFWIIFYSYERLLPRHVLVIRREENWLKRYSTELTIGLAILSFIISLIALFHK